MPAPALRPLLRDADPAGPAAARLALRALAAVSLVAWVSLAVQVRMLIGWEGIAPVQTLRINLRAQDPWLGLSDFPTHFFFDTSDTAVLAGCGVGIALSALALLGLLPRLLLPLSGLLYLSHHAGTGVFLAFQWDNLLIEASLLAALLPTRGRAPAGPPARGADRLGWWGLRLLLFKLLFESGLAKLLSPRGDWLDGTAMQHYYETAPLPTPFARAFHALPAAWHRAESWATLAFELVLVWGIFGGRGPRRVVLAALLGFLALDGLTANYGFFLVLTAALGLSLVGESRAAALEDRLRAWVGRAPVAPVPPAPSALRRGAPLATGLVLAAWTALSLQAALAQFAHVDPATALRLAARKARVANTYHLFASVTTTRDEPEIQVSENGVDWTALVLHHKPGPPDRAPSFLPLHMPRVDFQLWFQGLSWRHKTPPWVAGLLGSVCHHPDALAALFVTPLPADPSHVRIVYWDTRFTAPGAADWWTRTPVHTTDPIPCSRLQR